MSVAMMAVMSMVVMRMMVVVMTIRSKGSVRIVAVVVRKHIDYL
jgi:hypothetical protein